MNVAEKRQKDPDEEVIAQEGGLEMSVDMIP